MLHRITKAGWMLATLAALFLIGACQDNNSMEAEESLNLDVLMSGDLTSSVTDLQERLGSYEGGPVRFRILGPDGTALAEVEAGTLQDAIAELQKQGREAAAESLWEPPASPPRRDLATMSLADQQKVREQALEFQDSIASLRARMEGRERK
ncbi:MAG: hypothetical protein OXI71_16315 [Gemmatimonadota bacterium]|nr:hypothetical protein [Gemmatimonadota bacterium]MYA44220.1 hypothetical protein [Gemmatimonadota bacterium]MYE91834.1 hypothetical protein [Gemmatimonadota bacterium]MYJ11276.1 hypothetical protein [Gemmatimonadota bacterium]